MINFKEKWLAWLEKANPNYYTDAVSALMRYERMQDEKYTELLDKLEAAEQQISIKDRELRVNATVIKCLHKNLKKERGKVENYELSIMQFESIMGIK